MKKRFDDAIHPKQRPLDSQPVLTERELRAATGGDMSIPEKKQANPG